MKGKVYLEKGFKSGQSITYCDPPVLFLNIYEDTLLLHDIERKEISKKMLFVSRW